MNQTTEAMQMNMLEPSIDELVRKDHPYRKLRALFDFKKLSTSFSGIRSMIGRHGYDVEAGFAALLLQWMEDLSDRQMERFLQENTSAKYFCGFTLTEQTPDHSYFGRMRNAIGPKRLAEIFRKTNDELRKRGVVSDIFIFVDASQLISKITTWKERDQAIKAGEEKLNNSNVGDYSADKDARFGCKGKDKFWYGYKRHMAVDMKHGIITKVAVTPANVSDSAGLARVCPNGGMVVADKAYCTKEAQNIMKAKGCHSGAIMKNKMKSKNRDKDRFLTKLRSPYENVFSKKQKRSRYRGIRKNQFQVFIEALTFNLKRLVTINAPPIFA